MVRKTKVSKTKKRSLRGGYYGATGAIAPGAIEWGRGSEMGDWALTQRGQNAIVGSARRRKSRKSTKKTLRRKMKGGGKYGGVSAQFEGQGVAGMANYSGRTTRDDVGTAALGTFNNKGAQPGSGFGSFVRV
jgi:hypothetical protein